MSKAGILAPDLAISGRNLLPDINLKPHGAFDEQLDDEVIRTLNEL